MTGDDEERKGKEVGLLKLGEPSREEYRADEARDPDFEDELGLVDVDVVLAEIEEVPALTTGFSCEAIRSKNRAPDEKRSQDWLELTASIIMRKVER